MQQPDALRRLMLASLALPALPLLQGCAAPLAPLGQATEPGARALLDASAGAHGLPALAAIEDVSVGYAGTFHPVVDRLQPELVDAGFRSLAQDRLLLRDRMIAQAQAGPKGTKQVAREAGAAGAQGTIRVWFNGEEAPDRRRRDAAALVADCYSLFLLGPMLLAGEWAADRTLTMALSRPERVTVDGRDHDCDVLRVRMRPGLGLSEGDELALHIDRAERLMRRLRFTLNGFQPTRGAVAEVDAWGHVPLHGVRWPAQYEERLLRPLPLPVHEWRLTGLDVNRGLDRAALNGPALAGGAARPAAALP